jgi:hypothetical protein
MLVSGLMLMVATCGGSHSSDSEPELDELQATHVCGIPDPACGPTEPAGDDCDTSKITCQTFAPILCPDGQVPGPPGA